jgi:hypothetical protein
VQKLNRGLEKEFNPELLLPDLSPKTIKEISQQIQKL